MDTAMPKEELREALDRVVREVTEHSAGIRLVQGDYAPGDDLCTVHIGFQRGVCSSLSLRADSSMFARLARFMLEEENVTPQDMEEAAKEYFNVLCGSIARALYQATRVACRFGVPDFYWGSFSPKDHEEQFVLSYSSGQDEAAQLVHHVPVLREKRDRPAGSKPKINI